MINIDIDGLSIEQIEEKYRSTILHGVEVMRFAAQGLSDVAIGERIFLSHGAVKSRLKALYPVIGARSRAHAVAICAANGWFDQDDLVAVLSSRQFRSVRGAKASSEAQPEA